MQYFFHLTLTITLSFVLTIYCSTTDDLRGPWSIAGISPQSFMLAMDTAVRLEEARLHEIERIKFKQITTQKNTKTQLAQNHAAACNQLILEHILTKRRLQALCFAQSIDDTVAAQRRMDDIHQCEIDELLKQHKFEKRTLSIIQARQNRYIERLDPVFSTHLIFAQDMIDTYNRLYA